MEQLNLHVSGPARWILREVLEQKGYGCMFYSINHPYFFVCGITKTFKTFSEAKGRKLIRVHSKHLSEIQLIPVEALIEYLKSIE